MTAIMKKTWGKLKYRNQKTNGYDSKKEAKRAGELKFLEKTGEIKDLVEQPRFLLQEAFEHQGKKYRKIEYVADFSYYDKGQYIVEDVKSPASRTPLYMLKKKLLLQKYPDINFIET